MNETWIIAFVGASFFLAALLKGVTGLGFSTLCLPLLVLAIDHKTALPLVLLPSLCSNVLVMRQTGRLREAAREYWPLVLAAVPGLILGLWGLGHLDSAICRAVLGVVLLVYAIWELHGARRWRPPAAWSVPVGFTTGMVNGLTGSQIMPLLPFLVARRLEKERLVAVANLSFTFSSLVMVLGLRFQGFLTREVGLVSLAGLAPVALGVWLGGRVRQRLGEGAFRRMILALLGIFGAVLILRLAF